MSLSTKRLSMRTWWKAAGVRCLKTICQTALGMVSVGAALSEVNWLYVASVSATAGILSLLTSLAGLPEVEEIEVSENITIQEEGKHD